MLKFNPLTSNFDLVTPPTDTSNLVPYTGAAANLELGFHDFIIGGSIYAPNALSTDVAGGALQLIAGQGDGIGTGGQITINGGHGGATDASGGAISLNAGGGQGDSDGVDIILTPSDATGANVNNGHVKFGIPHFGADWAIWDTSPLSTSRTYTLPDETGVVLISTLPVSTTGANGTLTMNSNTDGADFNLFTDASGTLAIYGSGGNTLNVRLLDGNLDAQSFSVAGDSGASGTFLSADAKMVTVTNGIITTIA